MDSQPPYKLVAGDNILLYASSRVVAVGSVHSVISSDLCNGVQIGQAPLTHSEQNDRAGPSVSNQALLIEGSPPNTRAGEERSGRKAGSVSKEEEIYFKFRKNWSNESVTLLSKIEGEPLAEGIIFLPFANSCIDGVEVGEEYAGVLVARACDDVDEQLLRRDLPKFIEDDPRMVRWPILRLRVISNGAILGKLYKAFVDSESSGRGSEPQEEGEKRKRPYNSVKRQKPDPTTQFKKKLS
ncbi:hypothetical protein R1sor_021483 [Riccia sorocarpa]|uniref:Uncharacterized protein n=1 Tax=Riccia sorocarpa TaxID=122646 RepID=A0ABD3GH70_9MARC